jgi:hypothetical protein
MTSAPCLPEWFMCLMIACAFLHGFMCGGYAGVNARRRKTIAMFNGYLSWVEPVRDWIARNVRRRS